METNNVIHFFQDQNDPQKNDLNAEVDPVTLQGLREMGAFGLQVKYKFNEEFAKLLYS